MEKVSLVLTTWEWYHFLTALATVTSVVIPVYKGIRWVLRRFESSGGKGGPPQPKNVTKLMEREERILAKRRMKEEKALAKTRKRVNREAQQPRRAVPAQMVCWRAPGQHRRPGPLHVEGRTAQSPKGIYVNEECKFGGFGVTAKEAATHLTHLTSALRSTNLPVVERFEHRNGRFLHNCHGLGIPAILQKYEDTFQCTSCRQFFKHSDVYKNADFEGDALLVDIEEAKGIPVNHTEISLDGHSELVRTNQTETVRIQTSRDVAGAWRDAEGQCFLRVKMGGAYERRVWFQPTTYHYNSYDMTCEVEGIIIKSENVSL